MADSSSSSGTGLLYYRPSSQTLAGWQLGEYVDGLLNRLSLATLQHVTRHTLQ